LLLDAPSAVTVTRILPLSFAIVRKTTTEAMALYFGEQKIEARSGLYFPGLMVSG
jgi:hypothetical protein